MGLWGAVQGHPESRETTVKDALSHHIHIVWMVQHTAIPVSFETIKVLQVESQLKLIKKQI